MQKLIVIFAVLSFVTIQFVHAAVLDGSGVQPHAEGTKHELNQAHADNHDSDNHNNADVHHNDIEDHHDDIDAHDDDHALGHLHKSFHDHHQVASFLSGPVLLLAINSKAQHFVESNSLTSAQFAPPVPPPLS